MIDAFARVSYRGPESFIRNLRSPNVSHDSKPRDDQTNHVTIWRFERLAAPLIRLEFRTLGIHLNIHNASEMNYHE